MYYLEHDFELPLTHPTNPSIQKPFHINVTVSIEDGEYSIEKATIHESVSSKAINELIYFCSPDFYQDIQDDIERYISRNIANWIEDYKGEL